MFKFSYKKFLVAIGFYLLSLLGFTLLSIQVVIIWEVVVGEANGDTVGTLIAVIISPILSMFILRQKGYSKNLILQLISGFSVILAYYNGAIISFIPAMLFFMMEPITKSD